MRFLPRLILAAGLLLPVFATAATTAATSAPSKDGIAWFNGDVDAAFAKARATNKPVFLYWGAIWCPYCNQVKATIFTRQDFIGRSRNFVAVDLDADAPGAQKQGARFKVRGYPTMILFKPDGSEITRLPGEIDPSRYLQVLTAGMSTSARPAKDALAAALSAPATVKADEWRLLAFYSWGQGEQSLIAEKNVPATLLQLAQSAPAGDAKTRLELAGLVAAADAKPAEQPAFDKAAALARVAAVVTNPKAARDFMDIFVNNADKLTVLLTAAGSPERAAFAKSLDAALRKLAEDSTLSRTDRLSALAGLASLARLDTPKGQPLDAALLQTVRNGVAAADKATTNIFERQSVVYTAAGALNEAGLLDEADTLLKAELKRSHSPYYFMSSLGGIAKKRGDAATALDWYEQAANAAKGQATRVRWGSIYATNVIDLAPADDARVEKAVLGLFAEVDGVKDAFYETNLARLKAVTTKLATWNKDGFHDETVARLRTRVEGICAKLAADDPQRASCAALAPAGKGA